MAMAQGLAMLRLCPPPNKLVLVRCFASPPTNAPRNSSPSSLSLESLEAYTNKISERYQPKKRTPVKRRASQRPHPPPTQDHPAFAALPLSPLLQQRLQELELTVPTDVQSAAIPVLLQGQDAAIQSFTGSGKTLAYLLPILSRVGPLKLALEGQEPVNSKVGIEAVVVAPSRELAMQIVREAERILGTDHRKAVQQLVGGANRSRQDEALRKNKPSIVVGTPGRISEISRDGRLHTHSCRFLILDEADELLSVQFREDMRRILEHVGKRKSSADERRVTFEGTAPSLSSENKTKDGSASPRELRKDPERVERQTVLVSATMPVSVLRAASEWGQKPLLVKGKSVVGVENAPRSASRIDQSQPDQDDLRGVKESLPPSIKHYYAVCQLQHKVDLARKCIHALNAKSVIVFMNHPRRLKDTVFKLEARSILAASLHGELGKLERTNTLAAFRNGKLRVLVTSEVGARGLDVPDCDLVVNLELPTDMTHYAHRAGRTGRLGRKGIVLSICEESEAFVLKKFQRQLGVPVEPCEFVAGGLVPCKDVPSTRTAALLKA